MKVKVAQSCPTLCNTMDCSPWNSPGQNTGVVGFPFSSGSSWPRKRAEVSCIAGRFFTNWAIREASKCVRPRITEDLCSPRWLITHLEPDILECEVKWALGSITLNKASGGDGIPVELFQILKDDAVKVLHSIYQQIWKTQRWPQDWKMLVCIPIPKKGNAKECSNYHTIALTC